MGEKEMIKIQEDLSKDQKRFLDQVNDVKKQLMDEADPILEAKKLRTIHEKELTLLNAQSDARKRIAERKLKERQKNRRRELKEKLKIDNVPSETIKETLEKLDEENQKRYGI